MKQVQEDKIISEFLKSLGPWREFVVIGGGFALFIYKLYLADPKLENLPVGTRDIDSLIPRRVHMICCPCLVHGWSKTLLKFVMKILSSERFNKDRLRPYLVRKS